MGMPADSVNRPGRSLAFLAIGKNVFAHTLVLAIGKILLIFNP